MSLEIPRPEGDSGEANLGGKEFEGQDANSFLEKVSRSEDSSPFDGWERLVAEVGVYDSNGKRIGSRGDMIANQEIPLGSFSEITPPITENR